MTANVSSLSEHLRGKSRRLKFAIGRTVENNKVRNVEWKWPEVVAKLRTPVCTTETYAEYMKMPLADQNRIKDVGYFVAGHFANGKRKHGNLDTKCVITLDADHLPEDHQDDVDMAFDHLAYVMHTTHKHCAEKPRKRFVFPLTRDVTEVEWLAIARKVGSWLNLDWIDHTTFQFSRVMHFPSCASDGLFESHENSGAWIDPDEVLATYSDWTDVSQWPMSSRETKELRLSADQAGNPLEKTGIVGAFCRAYSIVDAIEKFIPDSYFEGTSPGRYTYAHGSSANGAVIYDDGLFLYSHHEHDPVSGRCVNAFDLVRLHKFHALDENAGTVTNPTKLPSFEAMVGLVQQDQNVVAELAAERLQLMGDFDDFGAPIIEVTEKQRLADAMDAELGVETDTSKDWIKQLILVDGQIAVKLTNLELLIQNDDRLRGVVRFNEFTKDFMQMRPIPGMKQPVPETGVLWSDLAEISIKGYLERRHRLTFSTAMIHEAVMTLGSRDSYNPVRAKLDGLEWDGEQRLDSFFIRHFGAEDTPYTRAVTRKWFAAAVTRVYRPGCKFDYILVLEGVEGLRKSSLFELLAYGWFTDNLSFGMEQKEVIETVRQSWIVEVPEMITRGGAESEHVKAFLSRRVDRARMAYARNAEDFPRQFVLVGTTNEATYLRSLTGNRRFWCLKGDGRELNLEAIARELDQLWAEAKDAFVWGEALWLDDAGVRDEAKAQQSARVVVDDLRPAIEAFLDKPVASNYWNVERGSTTDFNNDLDDLECSNSVMQLDRCCALQIWLECMNGDLRSFTRRESARINDILRSLPNWKEETTIRFGVRYGRARGFFRQ